MAFLLSLLVVGGGFFVTTLAFADDVEVTGGEVVDGEVANIGAQSDLGPIAKVTTGSTNTEYYDLKMALEDWEGATSNSTLFVMREVTDTDLSGIKSPDGVITIPFDNYASGVRKMLDLNGNELNASIVVQTHCSSTANTEGYSPLEFVLSSGTLTGSLQVMNGGAGIHDYRGGGVNVSLAGGANVNGGVLIPETTYYWDDGYLGFTNSLVMTSDCGTVGGVYIGKKSTFTMHGGTITNGEDGKITELEGRGVYLGQNAAFTMTDGAITGNKATDDGGGVYAEGPFKNADTDPVENVFTMTGGTISDNSTDGAGGGVYVQGYRSSDGTYSATGKLSITNGEICNNSANDGGGVYVAANGTFSMDGGTISNNSAAFRGGGVYVQGYRSSDGIYSATGILGIKNGEICNNSAALGGGGVFVGPWGNFTMRDSSISGNTAAPASESGSAYYGGGGVYVAANGSAIMLRDTIGGEDDEGQSLGNQATNGGGIYIAKQGKVYMGDGTISNNVATGNGGGVYVQGENYDSTRDYSTAFEMVSSAITKNEATGNGGGVWFSGGAKHDNQYYGKFIMGPGTISDNTAANGGGVYVAGGQFVLKESTESIISGNKANAASANAASANALTGQEEPSATDGNGGGVYIAGAANAEATGGELYMDGAGTISSNTATTNGGGVYVAGGEADNAPGGLFVMKGTIGGTTTDADGKTQSAGNTATDGGGVYVAGGATSEANGGRFAMGANGDTISNNTATGNGGGVYLADGATDSALTKCGGWLTMSAGTITSNTATTKGGGVYVAKDKTLIIWGALNITENTTNEKANNVHLYQAQPNTENRMKVEGNLLNGSKIGVTTDVLPTPGSEDSAKIKITEGYGAEPNQSVDPATYFTSDVEASEDGTQKYFVCWYRGHAGAEGNMEATLQVHVHNWTYTANDATLTATCDATGAQAIHGACVKDPEQGQDVVTLTRTLSVPAATKTYDGKAVTATLSEEKLWTETDGLIEPEISYYKEGKTNPLPGAPKDAGSYVAKATVKQEGKEDVVAQASFSITPLEAKLNWTTTLTYNGKEQQPPVTVSNLVKGDSCSVTVDGKGTTVGSYQATATALSNANYVLPDEKTTQFTIAPLEAKLAWTNTSFVYDAKGHMPTATVSNLVNGDICIVTVTGEQTKAGTHKATATKLSNENYKLPANPTTQFTIASSTVTYTAHVQTYGNRGPVTSGPVGTIGKGKRLESLTAKLSKGTIEYRSHVQGKGWEKNWAKDGGVSGTVHESRRVEAIQMKISDAEGQHVWYRVHSQSYGWLGWAKDGEPAGTAGQSKRIEAYEIVILPDGQTPKGYNAAKAAFVSVPAGKAHVQGLGWVNRSGTSFGTTGSSRRIEAFGLKLSGLPWSGKIVYQSHVQGIGWQSKKADGALSGTTGKSKRVEAVRISLEGEAAKHLSVWYRVHSQTYGWLGWTKDGANAGTAGLSKRVEAIEVVILPNTAAAPGSTARAFRTK